MKLNPVFKPSSSLHALFGCCFLILLLSGLSACGGSGGGDGSITAGAKAYSTAVTSLYNEVPAITITGGAIAREGSGFTKTKTLHFNPKSPKDAEDYDSDGDGIVDEKLNDYLNYVNAANRMFDADIAQCYGNNTGSLIWTKSYQPDTLPATAVEGTQYIKLAMPFEVDPTSLFELDPLISGFDFLSGAITIIDEDNRHVNCTVLLDGKDAIYYREPEDRPDGHTAEDHDYTDRLPPQLIGKNIIVFVAQSEVDQAALRKSENPVFRLNNTIITAFTSVTNFPDQWLSDKNEIRIRVGQIRDIWGVRVNANASYYAAKTNFDPVQVLPNLASTDITAMDIIGKDEKTIDPDTGLPFEYPNNQIISRTTTFLLTFNKPVVPESVARSLLFDRPPFNGNTQVIPSRFSTEVHLPQPCQGGGGPPPLATNVSVIAQYIDKYGKSQTQAVIPFRCHPIHQNNMAAYVIDPLIDLPGSTDPDSDPENPFTMRIEVSVYPSGTNSATGDPDDASPIFNPINLAPSGYFGETYTGGGNVIQRTFSVEHGGRYVNTPVSPHALYYSMGPQGIGAVDLDGNGFTTNHPDFSKPVLVTSLRFYNKNGSAGLGTGNNYAYGAKANPGSYVGLGSQTGFPGVNEGSGDKDNPTLGGIDTVVRDSNGRSQLYPDPTLDQQFLNVNITDIELGDFLDTIFFDHNNRWAKNTFHVSLASAGLFIGKYQNNIIDTPPTPNPPPLTLPIGMRAVDYVIDRSGLLAEGVFVIMGKEVFTFGLHNDPSLILGGTPMPWDTAFIHLQPAESAGTKADKPFPPNPFLMFQSYLTDFTNTGPLAESATIGTGYYYGSRQQIGNFLFAADKSNNEVKVINSNSMDVITTLSGFSAPDSVAVSPDLKSMYVTNAGSGFLSVFNVDPRSEGFLTNIADVAVGVQPKGLCVQPDFEDVMVCNYGDNSISIVNPADNTVRKTVTSLLNRPWDIVAGPRQTYFGFQTQIYHAYISNFGGNNVLVFESGPSGLGGVGYDDILDPVPSEGFGGQVFLPVQKPRGLCWDPHFLAGTVLSGGVFVAHSSGSYSVVSRIQFTKQQGTTGPILIVTPRGLPGGTPGFGKRVFEITAQWGGPDNPLSGGASGAADVALMDYNRNLWQTNNWTGDPYVTNYGGLDNNPKVGMPINDKHPIRFITVFGLGQYSPVVYPDRLFVSFTTNKVIDVINPLTGTILNTITGLPAPAKVMKTYFKY